MIKKVHHVGVVVRDMEQAMRSRGIPLFSVDTHRPAGDFDLLAFNLSAELAHVVSG